jgi:hypothetical protein
MKFTLIFVCCFVAPNAYAEKNQQASVAAVQKVINMLADMTAKAKKEKKDEEVAFAEFGTWCTGEKANLKKSIKDQSETMELLSSEITKLSTEVKILGEEIAKLSSNVAEFEADIKSSTAQRAKDNTEYLAESQDYSESVDALDRAIVVLQKQDYDRTGSKAALLQLAEKNQLPAKVQAMVSAFIGMMQDDSDPKSYSAPEANAYEFQSGGVVAMLKKLKDEFREKLAECQKEEMNSKHAFDMKLQDLKDSVENSNKDKDEKTEEKAKKMEKIALDKKELASTTASKEADVTTLSDVTTECEEKTFSFKEKQQLRTEEIVAMEKAIEILSSEEVKTGETHLTLTQSPKKATSFTQFRGTNVAAEENEGIRRRVREFLESEGNRLHNRELALLAQKLAADPFVKVKKMIDDMITRLLEEANGDAEHEGFCDTEVGKSKVTRAKLSEDIDALTAAVEEGKATIMMITEEIATLTKDVADLVAAMADATKLRNAEKAKNQITIEDAEAAKAAVAAAVAVLKKILRRRIRGNRICPSRPGPARDGFR